MPRVEVVGVRKRFGDVEALRGVDLSIEDGEYVCIIGPSGCGKTTLLRIIAGLIPPDEGHVYIDGKLMDGVPPEDRGLGFAFQNIALFPHMSVLDNVAYGLRVRGKDASFSKKVAREMLRISPIEISPKALPRELSGGAAQAVAIARALATGAKLLLLDEPLGALDARVRVSMRYELRRIVKDLGLTAIHVTHNQAEAMSIADKVVVMRSGRVMQVGAPRELFWQPQNLFVAYFVGEITLLEGYVVERSEGRCSIELREGVQLVSTCPERARGDHVVAAIRPERVKLYASKVDGENVLRGKVLSARVLAGVLRYEVLLENGETLLVKEILTHAKRRALPETSVWVQIPPQSILLFDYPSIGLMREISLE